MKKALALGVFCSLGLGVSLVNAQLPDNKPKLVQEAKPKDIKDRKKIKAVPKGQAQGMENPEQLCGSNTVISSKTETCNETDTQVCRRRVAQCANATGGGGYTSHGVCTDCVPKSNPADAPEKKEVN